jgi:hypothetical protein
MGRAIIEFGKAGDPPAGKTSGKGISMKLLTIFVVATLAVGLAAELALIQPGEVAAQPATKGAKPAIIHVGPNLLYRGKHIPGSIYAGPGSRPDGLEASKWLPASFHAIARLFSTVGAVRGATAPT